MALIRCENVSIGYEGQTVVRDLEFSIDAGDYLCIVGENGSGKSTLVRSILGLKNVEKGRIIYGDGLKKNEIGYLPQQTDTQTVEVYGCADCSGCEHKSKCLYRYNAQKNPDRNKVMKINERWEALREESNANIQSEEGILKRQTRSIQTEGHFGDIKENESFRRFNYRSAEKVYKEFMLYAIGRNILKYHRFLHHEIEKYEGKKEQKAA